MVMRPENLMGYFNVSGRIAAGAACMCMLCSCAVVDWFAGKTSDEEVKEMDSQLAESVSGRATAYDTSLRNFGQMLEAYNIGSVRVQSKLISNQTAEKTLPDDVSRMLISAVNKIGNKVVYVPYDPSYILNEANTGGDISRALPKIVLAGGITEFDKDLIEKGRELKSEVSIQKGDYGSSYSHDGGAGYQAESGVSRITLDLQLMNYASQTYLSGIQAINQVNIRKTKLGWGIGYFFQGSGLSFQYSLQKKQGKYYAIRLLVELSVLEVLGKYFDVPYWRCVEGMQPDMHMVARLRDEFQTLDDAQQLDYIKEYLFFHGETGFNRGTGSVTQAELAKVDELMRKNGCTSKADLFVKLWETVPISQARMRNRDYDREAARNQRQEQDQQQQLIAQYNKLIADADALYSSGKLSEAAELYRQAGSIFPDQQDPKDMLVRIARDLESRAAAAAPTVAVPQNNVVTPAPPPVAPQPAPAPAQEAVNKKEKPLNPFQAVEW
eukprot:TRINITY_DN3899_c0_g1_i7.p1 TRINITY_DN3899_c0_g1~~TRINITY_DN3899_c0_g1_i7.p1  ORF type:complete len:496 (-),score=109.00 TRINITY_DN3899_c0_g1_i7:36-1523(-)